MTTIRQNLVSCILVLLLSTSCASKEEATRPAESYFKEAMTAIDDNDSLLASEMLQKLNNQHPFSPYAHQALLELAYLEFVTGNRTAASANLDRFMRLHIGSEQLDYAYYLRGIIAFSEGRSILQDYTNIDPALRDLSEANNAYKDFDFLIRNFPNSRFAQDSRAYMVYIRTMLANQEVAVGEFYLKRKAWLAAANRGNYVLEYYSDAGKSVAKALDIMVFSYTQMGMTEKAQEAGQILASNFPDYKSIYLTE